MLEDLHAISCDTGIRLRKPARLEKLERIRLRFPTIPDDFLVLYNVHDGQDFDVDHGAMGGLLCGYRFNSLAQIFLENETWSRVRAEEVLLGICDTSDIPSWPERCIKPLVHHSHWLPFASGYGGAQLALDLAPDQAGVLGQVINFGPDDRMHFRLAGSLAQFLRELRRQYARRKFHPIFHGDNWSLHDELCAMTRNESQPDGWKFQG